MRKITEYLGKPVLSLYESVTEGIVSNVVFDKNLRKLKFIVLFNDNEFQEERVINVNDIYSYGENAIIIKNNACLELRYSILDETSNPINNHAYTTLGKFLGIVSDVEIDEKNNVVQVDLSSGESIDISKVVTSGRDAMFIQDEENLVKLSNFKKKNIINNKQNKEIKVQIMPTTAETLTTTESTAETDSPEQDIQPQEVNIENLAEPQEVKPIKPKKKVVLNADCLPTKKVTKDNFLVGRKVEKNIYSFNHELIIKKNTRVTEKTIVTAKSHSKLKELALYSK